MHAIIPLTNAEKNPIIKEVSSISVVKVSIELKQEIEELKKRNDQLKEFNDLMAKNKTYTVGEFTYDTASGKAIAGPGKKQEERKIEEGSSKQKAANSKKILKQRVQIKQVEDDIDRQLLERQFEFQNKMEEAMGIEDEQLILE